MLGKAHFSCSLILRRQKNPHNSNLSFQKLPQRHFHLMLISSWTSSVLQVGIFCSLGKLVEHTDVIAEVVLMPWKICILYLPCALPWGTGWMSWRSAGGATREPPKASPKLALGRVGLAFLISSYRLECNKVVPLRVLYSFQMQSLCTFNQLDRASEVVLPDSGNYALDGSLACLII